MFAACDDAAMDDDPSPGDPVPGDPVPGGPVSTGPWLRHTRRVAYENPWITIWHDEVTRPDGEPGVYGVVHFARPPMSIVHL